MSDLRTAAQQALEALEYIHTETTAEEDKLIHTAITALRAALAQQEQEPVAWMYEHDGMVHDASNPPIVAFNRWKTPVGEPYTETPLYTHPPRREWRSLSEEEVWSQYQELWPFPAAGDIVKFARAIEQALKEKNHE